MNRIEDSHAGLKGRPHEIRLQELRHERRTEADRLDGLKKTLQNKMQGDKGTGKIRAA